MEVTQAHVLVFLGGFSRQGPSNWQGVIYTLKKLVTFVRAGSVAGLLEQVAAIVNINVCVTSILNMCHIH